MKKLVHTPDGVRDIYGEEELRKLSVEATIKNVIYSYGYEAIQTPTFEYFDIFSQEIGTTPSKELYKFFDKEGDTLVLRSDFTPSIARCVSKYHSDTTEPIRLTYHGNTFLNASNLQGKLKEVTQIGVELMNDDTAYADAEMIHLVIESLKAAGLSKFQVSIGEMDYFKGLCENAGIDATTELTLREFISTKNSIAALELIESLSCADETKELLNSTASLIGGIEVISNMLSKVNNERSVNALKRLIEVYDILKIYGDCDYVSFDLGILSKYNYYTGVIFKAYTYGIGDACVKGGRYNNLLEAFGNSKPAIGFCIVVDDLMMAMKTQKIDVAITEKPTDILYNNANLADKIKEAEALRKQGKAVRLLLEK